MAVRSTTRPKRAAKSVPAKAARLAKKQSAALLVDEELDRYRSMRDFGVTAEPMGEAAVSRTAASRTASGATASGAIVSRARAVGAAEASRGLRFVIQKHAATRLHYDFRLEWNGVLKSWAVTNGPSFYPGDKRLAVRVEDHPLEYGGFEGIIPKGQYGGGAVMVWDRGTWLPHGDAEEGLESGHLTFELHGQKLKGSWALIRMRPRPQNKGKANWLLIKEHDPEEYAEGDTPITESAPESALTGRDMDEIAGDQDRVWNSKDDPAADPVATKPPRTAAAVRGAKAPAKEIQERAEEVREPSRVIQAPGSAPREAFPRFISPQLASQVKSPPAGAGWAHELKLDGYRIQAHIRHGRSALLTRNGLDWTHRMKDIAARVARLPVQDAVLDGEVVVLAPDGGTSFADLQAAFQDGSGRQLTYFVFDVLHLNGRNLRNEPLSLRKELLRDVISPAAEDEALRYSEHLSVDGGKMFREACRMGAEGIVSKLLSSKYHGGRSCSWLKVKCIRQQEFVVGGFTLPSDGSGGIGALLLGYYEGGKLVYAGRTGTGFSQASGAKLRRQLESMQRSSAPYDSIPSSARRGAIWAKPQLVAEVAFATWTADNLVRQAVFKGLREDKSATEVEREAAMTLKQAEEDDLSALVDDPFVDAPLANDLPEMTDASARAAEKGTTRGSRQPSHLSFREGSTGNSPARYQVRLTHPDKQIDAASKLTKQQLADYYSAVADAMLPHIADRPLSIVRCPQGSTGPCFFQKHLVEGLPPGIDGVMIQSRKGGEPEEYITLSTGEALVGLAQLGVLEIHPWGSTNSDLERPDRMIFDLDPDPSLLWATLAGAALEVRERLKKLGLASFVKSTGGKGLHVVAPIEPHHEWPAAKAFAKSVAQAMAADNPQLYLMTMTKAARKGRIYVDYLRNERGATAIAPYSPRARAGVPVAIPLAWKEMEAAERPVFAVTDFPSWEARLKRDPWAQMLSTWQTLPH